MSIELAAVLSTITDPPAQKYWLPTDKTRDPVPSCINTMIPDCPTDSVLGLAKVTLPVAVKTKFW